MRFWDASALVPLVFQESATRAVLSLLQSDPRVVVWWGTRTEIVSAVVRCTREAGDDGVTEARARKALSLVEEGWSEIPPVQAVRELAERMLWIYALRAADALQLAAALVWSKESTLGKEFVCLDTRLGAAAAREGFTILP